MAGLNKGAVAVALAGALIWGCSLSVQAQEAHIRVAQNYGGPPADVGGSDGQSGGPPGDIGSPNANTDSSDDASLLVRVEKLEDQIRQMNGQIEQMQFDNHRLEDQLRKFQEDVDFRFQDSGHGGKLRKRSDATDLFGAPAPLAGDAPSTMTPSATSPHSSHGDAFDPNTDPNAPGA